MTSSPNSPRLSPSLWNVEWAYVLQNPLLTKEQALALVKTRAAWKPPPEMSPKTSNIYRSGSSIPHGVIHGATVSLKTYPDIEREIFRSAVGPYLGGLHSLIPLTSPAFTDSATCPAPSPLHGAGITYSEPTHTITYTHPATSYVQPSKPLDHPCHYTNQNLAFIMHPRVNYGRQVAPSIYEKSLDVESYLTKKLPVYDESLLENEHYRISNPHNQCYQLVNIDVEQKERDSHVSEHLPIKPECCGGGGGGDSLTMSKATSGVRLNNE